MVISDTVVVAVVVAVGEVDGVADIGEKNNFISTIRMSSIFGLVETARLIPFFLLCEKPRFAYLFLGHICYSLFLIGDFMST